MNYEIDKKLAAKEHKERRARSFFPCDLCVPLRQNHAVNSFRILPRISAFFRLTPTALEIGPSRFGDIRRTESPPVALAEQASGLYHSASLSAKAALAAADGRIAGSEGHRAGRPPQQAGDLFHPRKNPSGSK